MTRCDRCALTIAHSRDRRADAHVPTGPLLDHWSQPLAIGVRRPDPLAVERLSYLLAAGGCDGILGEMEIEALRFEFEAEEIEHPASLALDVVDDILVLNRKDPFRRGDMHRVEQADIVAIEAANVAQVVRGRIAGSEEHLEITNIIPKLIKKFISNVCNTCIHTHIDIWAIEWGYRWYPEFKSAEEEAAR